MDKTFVSYREAQKVNSLLEERRGLTLGIQAGKLVPINDRKGRMDQLEESTNQLLGHRRGR